MIEIIIKNGNKCKIFGDIPVKTIRQLDDELSYLVPGAQYSYQYKVRGWDGRKRLLNSKLEFGYGLLNRVVAGIKAHGLEVTVTDKRTKTKAKPIDIVTKLTNMKRAPRDYQTESASKVLETDIGIVKVATGGGKTQISALMIANLGKPANLYVTGKDLLYQFHEFYSSIFDEPIGIIGDGHCDIKRINVVSVWSVSEAFGEKAESDEVDIDELLLGVDKQEEIRQCLSDAKVHIFDECHGVSCSTVQLINENIYPDEIYGMSASPWRSDNSELLIEAMLGKNIVDISASYLIEKGFLVQPIIKMVKVPKYPTKLKKNYQSVYKQYIVENEARNNLIVENTEKLVNLGYKVLVLFNSIKHGEVLYKMLSEKLKVALLSGKDSIDKRNTIKDQIQDGTIQVALVSRIFDIGVDLPQVNALVCSGAGKSIVPALQRIGRVLRPYPGKKVAAVIDFIDDAPFLNEHSLIRKKIYKSEEGFIVKEDK